MTETDCKYRDDVITLKNNMQTMKEDVAEIKSTLNKFIEKADEKYVSKIEYNIMKSIVYGAVGIGLIFISTQILNLIKP